MKQVILALFLLFSIANSAQTTPKTVNEEEKKEEAEIKFSSNTRNYSAVETANYSLFNHRKDQLLKEGNQSNILNKDISLNGYYNAGLNENADSYNTKMMQFWINGKDLNSAQYLVDAYAIDPYNADAYDEVLEYANWANNSTLEKEVALKIKSTNKYDKDIYSYCKDLLNTLPKNAVLITNGEIESVCSRVIQLTENLREDVTVIRIEWLDQGRYDQQRLKSLGLNPPNQSNQIKTWESLAIANSTKSFFISLTVPKKEINQSLSRLFLIGLAFQYGESPLFNIESIENNWQKFYSKRPFKDCGSDYYSQKLLSNYLLSGIKLYTYYNSTGDRHRAKQIKNTLKIIAEKSGQYEKLKDWL